MPADIVGKTGTSFSFTTTTGSLVSALPQDGPTGTVTTDVKNNIVTAASLPAGYFTLLLTIIKDGASNPALQILTQQPQLTYVTDAGLFPDVDPADSTAVIVLLGK